MRRRGANYSRAPRDALGRCDQFTRHPDALRASGRAPSSTRSASSPSSDLPGVGRNLIDHVLVPVVADADARRAARSAGHQPRSASVTPRAARTSSTTCRCTCSTFSTNRLWIGSAIDLPCPSIARRRPDCSVRAARGRGQFAQRRSRRSRGIDLNYLGDPEDMRRHGRRRAYRMAPDEQRAASLPYVKDFVNITDEIVDSDSAAADFVRNNCGTIYHPISTAKMGPDSDRRRWSISIAACAGSRACAWLTPR